METSTFNSGALVDTRPAEKQAGDWQQREVVAQAANVQWVEKQPNQIRKFPIFNQDGSGSCVMQTQCKELGIMRHLTDGNYVHFSVADGYQRRSNKPAGGMAAVDARQIAQAGITLEELSPSQNMSDAQLDAVVVESYKHEVGSVFGISNYLALPTMDIDSVASTIQATGKGVMVWFYFLIDEWQQQPVVLHSGLDLNAATTLRHSVCAVDFTLRGGEKCLVIEDSWGPNAGDNGQRIITESFFKARNWYAGYLVNFKFQASPEPKPHAYLQTDLVPGMTSDDVKSLQACLQWDGEFPANAQITGYYGPITQKAVGDYQIKHGVLSSTTSPGYGRCGPLTRGVLNAQFA